MGAKKNKKRKKDVAGDVQAQPPTSGTSAMEDDALREIAHAEKKKGNEEYLKKKYSTAVTHYTRGIASSREPDLLILLLVNRAIAFLRIKEYQFAVEDSTSAISLESNNIRAHIALAFGHFFMQNFNEAFEAYDIAIKLQPQTPELQSALQKALTSLSAQHKKIKDTAMQAAKTGNKLRETVLEWLGDFGLLSIDEEPLPNPSTESPMVLDSQPPKPYVPPPTRTHASAPPPTSAPAVNPAVAWARPTSVKSELVGSDENLFLEDAPPLVALGDAMYHVQWEQPYNVLMQSLVYMHASEREKLAESAKTDGNKYFQEQKYKTAIGHYSKALLLGSNSPKGLYVYYSNRAQAYLKLRRWSEAITDCTLSICCFPTAKAYMRRAAARTNLNMHLLAIQDYRNALHIDHNNLECIQEFEKLLKKTEEGLNKDPAANGSLLKEIKEERKHLATLKANVTPPPPPSHPPSSSSSFTSSSSTPYPSSYPSSASPFPSSFPAASININIKPAPHGKNSSSHFHSTPQFTTTISPPFKAEDQSKLEDMLEKFTTVFTSETLGSGTYMAIFR